MVATTSMGATIPDVMQINFYWQICKRQREGKRGLQREQEPETEQSLQSNQIKKKNRRVFVEGHAIQNRRKTSLEPTQ